MRGIKGKRAIAFALMLLLCGVGFLRAAITPSLMVNRSSGPAPLAVLFDASDTTDGAVAYPFHDDDFQWDFDDPASGVWSTDGKPRNRDRGPVAAHVFDVPGTYVVGLTVRNPGGETAQATVTITVEDPAAAFPGTATVCVSGAGDFTGCPSGAKTVTTSDMAVARAEMQPGTRVLFHRGEQWSYTTQFGHNGTGLRVIGAYPETGAKPRFSLNSGSAAPHFRIGDQARNLTVMDIDFENGRWIMTFGGEARNVLLYRTTNIVGTIGTAVSAAPSAADIAGLDLSEQVFVVDNHFDGFGYGSPNILFLGLMRFAVVGNVLWDVTAGEHIFRLAHGETGVISHNDMGPQAPQKGVLTIRSSNLNGTCTGGCGRYTRRIVTSDNTFRNASDIAVGATSKNASTQPSHGEDLIFDSNFFVDGSGAPGTQGQLGLFIETSERVTIRNNVFQLNGFLPGASALEISLDNFGGDAMARIYNNTAFVNTVDGRAVMIRYLAIPPAGTVTFTNNLMVGNTLELVRGYDPVSDPPIPGLVLGTNLLLNSGPFASPSPSQPVDFALAPGSAPVNAGDAVPVYSDWRQGARPVNGAMDVGAFELAGPADSMPPARPRNLRTR